MNGEALHSIGFLVRDNACVVDKLGPDALITGLKELDEEEDD